MQCPSTLIKLVKWSFDGFAEQNECIENNYIYIFKKNSDFHTKNVFSKLISSYRVLSIQIFIAHMYIYSIINVLVLCWQPLDNNRVI